MENGTYTIASGAVNIDFRSDERITNLPHTYISQVANRA